MSDELFILADSDSSTIKLLFVVGFFVIWGISAMVSWSKKQGRHQQSGQASWQDILRDLQGGGAGEDEERPVPPAYPYPPPLPQQMSQAQRRTLPPRKAQMPPQRPPRQKRPNPPRRAQAPAYNPRNRGQRPPAAHGVGRGIARIPVAPPPPPQAETAVIVPRMEVPTTTVSRQTSAAALLTRKNLRQQFILIELLRPPVTLRDENSY